MLLNPIRKNNLFSLCYRIVIVLLILLANTNASASGIVSVQGIDIKPYNDVFQGFKSMCSCDAEQLVISEMRGMNVIKEIKESKPDLIISIGITALDRVKEIKDIPIVYLMVLDPAPLITNNTNITGINIYIPPDKQLTQIRNIIPHIKHIGLVYDPALNGNFVKKAIPAAKVANIDLTVEEIRVAKDFPALLNGMKDNIDAFWMLPDLTAFTPETTEFLFLFSIENNIPVITFSEKYLEMGALISFSIDAFDMGKQAYEISDKLLKGAKISRMKKTFARKLNIEINQKTAKKFGIFNINNKLIKAVAINLE